MGILVGSLPEALALVVALTVVSMRAMSSFAAGWSAAWRAPAHIDAESAWHIALRLALGHRLGRFSGSRRRFADEDG